MGRSAAGGAWRRTQAVVAACVALALAAAACAGSPRRREPPEPALRIWTPGIVWWDDTRRTFPLEVENGTGRPVQIEAPGPRRARVILFAGPEQDPVCSHEADASGPAGAPVSLAPGEGRAVRVDLEAACGRLPPGEYRYEVGYEAPAAGPGPSVRLRSVHGHVVVRGGGSQGLDRGSLGSQRGADDDAGARFHGLSR